MEPLRAGAPSRPVPGRASGDRTCSARPRKGRVSAGGRRSPCYTPPPVEWFGPPREPTRSFALPTIETRNEAVTVLDELVSDQLRTDLPELASGDTVKVSAKVVEGNRERIQVFEGIVMRL